MIKSHSNWEFIYIGADIDSYAVGSEIGIKSDNISNYKTLIQDQLNIIDKSIFTD